MLEHFQGSFRAVTVQFQSSISPLIDVRREILMQIFSVGSEQFRSSFGAVSVQFFLVLWQMLVYVSLFRITIHTLHPIVCVQLLLATSPHGERPEIIMTSSLTCRQHPSTPVSSLNNSNSSDVGRINIYSALKPISFHFFSFIFISQSFY